MSAWMHRRQSYVNFGGDLRGEQLAAPKWKWHMLENDGSYKGWFDWVPRYLRVGPWSPTAPLFLVSLFASMYIFKPRMDLPVTAPPAFTAWWWVNVCVSIWCCVLVAYSIADKNLSIWPFIISYTGWSWSILGLRAGCSALGALLGSAWLDLFSEALRFPVVAGAVITFFVWNFLLLPVMLFGGAFKTAEQRKGFIRFNFGFFMTNVHGANFPLAMLNTVVGDGARTLAPFDLWCALSVVCAYAILYLFILDRLGVHLYPMFSPRTHFCSVGYSALFALYYALYSGLNSFIL